MEVVKGPFGDLQSNFPAGGKTVAKFRSGMALKASSFRELQFPG